MMPKKVTALYLRVSTSHQEKGLQSQKAALVKYCELNGIETFETFEDFAVSGAKSSRLDLDRMMSLVRAGGVERVVVASFSRFARSTKHLLEALELFRSLDVEFISLSESVDTASAMGKLVFTFVSAIAEFERELIRERVRRGLEGAKARGQRLGRPRCRPAELIRALIAQGLSYREVARLAKCSHWAITEELKIMRTEKLSA